MLAVLALLATVGFTSCDELAVEDNPMQAYLTMRTSDVTLKVGETYVRKAVAAGTAVVVYSSSDATVATVDQAGTVTAVAAGTAVITAQTTGYNAEGKKIYLPEEKSYKVTVKAASLPAAAWAANEYNEGSWDGTKVVFTKQTAASVTAVANSDAAVTWSAGWYTVSGNVTINGIVTLGAHTHLILQDGATLTINGELNCRANGMNLYIYGQKKGDGKLNVTNNVGYAINSDADYRIDIHGGEVTASAAGNTGYGLYTGYLAVYGGKLTSTSGGRNGIGFNNTMDVYGGEVVATSNATSSSTARYGIRSGGLFASQILTVYGGKVTATGNGVSDTMSNYGSGFRCYVKSGADIMFYFSDNGTAWDTGTYYLAADEVGTDAATKKRYAKAE